MSIFDEIILMKRAIVLFVPKEVVDLFPHQVDGHLIIDPTDNPDMVEICVYRYADDNPYKERKDTCYALEQVPLSTAQNLFDAVKLWNTKAEKLIRQKQQERLALDELIFSWANSLPEKISGFHRVGTELIDNYENHIADLYCTQLRFKTLEELEVLLLECVE